MWFSVKVLRPLFADIEESQGKYARTRSTRSKGSKRSRPPRGELAFRDAMLNEFLGVSRKMFRANFIVMAYDSVLRTIGLVSTALFLWVGATQVMQGQLSVGGFVAFSSLTAMAYGGDSADARRLGSDPARLGAAEPPERHLRARTGAGTRSFAPGARAHRSKATSSCAASAFSTADRRRRTS